MKNYVFIDGQNLYQGLERPLDYQRFRVYLKDKYDITKAYYFLGFHEREYALYERLQESGFILVFNHKGEHLKSNKKGNVDTNIVFHMMKAYIEDSMDKIFLVSGDGDYKMVVDYLIQHEKFGRLLFPNKAFASSLYNQYTNKYYQYLEFLKEKLQYKKKGS